MTCTSYTYNYFKRKSENTNHFGLITTKFVQVEVQTTVTGSLKCNFYLENIEFAHLKKKRISRPINEIHTNY